MLLSRRRIRAAPSMPTLSPLREALHGRAHPVKLLKDLAGMLFVLSKERDTVVNGLVERLLRAGSSFRGAVCLHAPAN